MEKIPSSALIHRKGQGRFFMCECIDLEKIMRMVVKSFFYHNHNDFRSFPPVAEGAFDHQVT